MGVITIRVRPEGLAAFKANWPADIERVKASIARRMEEQGRALVAARLGRWQTGELAGSLEAEPTSAGISMEIGAGVPHADYVFFGAPRHDIFPKRGRALSWWRFGTRFAFGKVDHPGQPARTDILNELEVLFLRIVQEEIEIMVTTRAIAGA